MGELLLKRKKRTKPSPMLQYGKEISIEIIGKIHDVYPEIANISDHKYDILEEAISKLVARKAEEIVKETVMRLK